MTRCALCRSDEKDDIRYGEFLTKGGMSVHTYCLYLTSNLCQRGNENEGFLGFLFKDIKKEVRRISVLKCYYCGKSNANIGCCNTKCRRTFHFVCGIKYGAQNEFFNTYKSYCTKHIHKVQYRPQRDEICFICYDSLYGSRTRFDSVNMLRAPCCYNGWFHKYCLQKCAKISGYFFKCPLCNDSDTIRKNLKKMGIFIPDQDAAWELEPGAFEDLLERPDSCAAIICNNISGRNDNSAANPLKICITCGSVAIHKNCVTSRNENFQCEECFKTIGGYNVQEIKTKELDDDNVDVDVCNTDESDEEDLPLTHFKANDGFSKNVIDSSKNITIHDDENEDIPAPKLKNYTRIILDDDSSSDNSESSNKNKSQIKKEYHQTNELGYVCTGQEYLNCNSTSKRKNNISSDKENYSCSSVKRKKCSSESTDSDDSDMPEERFIGNEKGKKTKTANEFKILDGKCENQVKLDIQTCGNFKATDKSCVSGEMQKTNHLEVDINKLSKKNLGTFNENECEGNTCLEMNKKIFYENENLKQGSTDNYLKDLEKINKHLHTNPLDISCIANRTRRKSIRNLNTSQEEKNTKCIKTLQLQKSESKKTNSKNLKENEVPYNLLNEMIQSSCFKNHGETKYTPKPTQGNIPESIYTKLSHSADDLKHHKYTNSTPCIPTNSNAKFDKKEQTNNFEDSSELDIEECLPENNPMNISCIAKRTRRSTLLNVKNFNHEQNVISENVHQIKNSNTESIRNIETDNKDKNVLDISCIARRTRAKCINKYMHIDRSSNVNDTNAFKYEDSLKKCITEKVLKMSDNFNFSNTNCIGNKTENVNKNVDEDKQKKEIEIPNGALQNISNEKQSRSSECSSLEVSNTKRSVYLSKIPEEPAYVKNLNNALNISYQNGYDENCTISNNYKLTLNFLYNSISYKDSESLDTEKYKYNKFVTEKCPKVQYDKKNNPYMLPNFVRVNGKLKKI